MDNQSSAAREDGGQVRIVEMAIEEFEASDGYRWKYRRYECAGEVRGIVVFVHGIQSHANWYAHSSSRLAQEGYRVYFLDRRGAGINGDERGDAPSFRRLLDDIAEFLAALPRAAPAGPARLRVFLAGISWGGKLAVALERRHPGLIDGMILLCPGFFAKVRPPFVQRLGIIFSRLIRPRKLYTIPLSDPELFTATPMWQQFLREDPLRLRQATARLLVESARLDGYLKFTPKYVHVPVLLLLASEDRIIRNEPTRVFVERFATAEKQVIEYPGAHHTLEFEPDPEKFISDIRGWLDRHTTVPKT